MSIETTQSNEKAAGAPGLLEGPRYVLRVVLYRMGVDKVTDLAAAMAFYLLLSVFPLLLAMVSILNLVGGAEWLVPQMEELVKAFAGEQVAAGFAEIVGGFLGAEGAGLALVISLLIALWSASGYIGAFTRAVNTVYQVSEGRNFAKLKGTQLLMTLALVLLVIVLTLALVVSSPAAHWLGSLVGLGPQFETIWYWLRFPLMGIVVVMLVQLLYFVSPNVRQPRVRFLSLGSWVAIVLAIGIFQLFNIYLSVFDGASNYAKTYGALAGVVIVLFMLFLLNIALLIGAELDSVMERLHQLKLGLPAAAGQLLPPRDGTGIRNRAATRRLLIERGEAIQARALADGATAPEWYTTAQLHAIRDTSLEAVSADPTHAAKPK